jgi:hypothetical protein
VTGNMAIELQQIRYFLSLCEEGTFTRAAERCGVSQPSLSNGIKQLEAELGGPLFERNRKACRLTKLGRSVLPHLVDTDRSVTVAKHVAAELLVGPVVLTSNRQEKSMRKVIYGVSITAAVLLITGAAVELLHASHIRPPAQRLKITDVYALEATIDTKALPRYDIRTQAEPD